MSNKEKKPNLTITKIVRDTSKGEDGPISEIHYVDEDGEQIRMYFNTEDVE